MRGMRHIRQKRCEGYCKHQRGIPSQQVYNFELKQTTWRLVTENISYDMHSHRFSAWLFNTPCCSSDLGASHLPRCYSVAQMHLGHFLWCHSDGTVY